MFPGTADYSPIQSAPVTFTIAPATPKITLDDSGVSAVYGQPVTFGVTVATAAGAPGGSITFLDGTTPLATVPLDGTGKATLTVSALAIGTHSIVADYSGDTNDSGVQSEFGHRDGLPGRHRDRVGAAARPQEEEGRVTGPESGDPAAGAGAGIPTGEVTFEVRSKGKKKSTEKVLGTAMLAGGAATLNVKSGGVAKQSITILYGGDADFTSSEETIPG